MIDRITWFDHASFMIEGERRVYIDPWEIPDGATADLILISHDHFDHCSPPDVAKIATKDTVIVTTPDCTVRFPDRRVVTVLPDEKRKVQGIEIETVEAYNLNKDFHNRSSRWVGFVFTLDGQRIYYVGDSDATPQMKAVKADIVLVPVGGTYTMDAREAAAAINKMMPAIAIPYHWGKIVGSEEDAELFKELCKTRVEILPKNKG